MEIFTNIIQEVKINRDARHMFHLLLVKVRECLPLQSSPKYPHTQKKVHQKHPMSDSLHLLTLISAEGNRWWYLHHPQFQSWNSRCLMQSGNYTFQKFHHLHRVFQNLHHYHRIIWMVIFLWQERERQRCQWMFVTLLLWIQQSWGRINKLLGHHQQYLSLNLG